MFYPPASWALGAALSAIFPWTVASTSTSGWCWSAAGVSMFVLVRQWLPRRDAIFAAVFYAVNPYHLVIVYWRSAFAELLASCVLPLLLLLLLRAADGSRADVSIVPLALLLAGAWLIERAGGRDDSLLVALACRGAGLAATISDGFCWWVQRR